MQPTFFSQQLITGWCISVCPTEVTISPNGGAAEVGTNFTCSAPSTPESDCICTLTDASGNEQAGEIVTLNTPGDYTLVCTATLSVNDTEQCNATDTADGQSISMCLP